MNETTSSVEIVPAILYSSGRETPIDLPLEHYDRADLLAHAITRLIGFWLVGGLTVFIPVVHLVSVPGCFIAGIVAAVLAWRREAAFLPVEGTCPVCDAVQEVRLDGKPQLPKLVPCSACGAGLVVKRRTDS